MLFEQAVADQKLNAALADLDRGNHGDAPGAALPEASGTDGGCRFMGHVTGCYYGINGGCGPIFRYDFGLSLFDRNTAQGPLLTGHGATLRCPQLSLYRGGNGIWYQGTRPWSDDKNMWDGMRGDEIMWV